MTRRWGITKSSKYSFRDRRKILEDWRPAVNARILNRERGTSPVPEYMCQLPALAKDVYNGRSAYGWGPKLREIIVGTRDHGSPLSIIRGFEDTLLRNIHSYIVHEYAENVILTIPAQDVGNMHIGKIGRYTHGRENTGNYDFLDHLPNTSRFEPSRDGQPGQGFVAFATCGSITFPEPANRNVNMLPFIFGDKSSLPSSIQCYYDCIEKCPYPEDYIGKVGYLTVHESYVEAGATQRREGLHIEAPGSFPGAAFTPGIEHSWGMGVFFGPDMYEGGIYMASSRSNTSEVWDALVQKDVPGIIDKHGGCEHLRPIIGTGTKLKSNQLIWMTDCTPHQAIPQQKGGARQFFRVVTPSISHWFAAHSTPNPLVPVPENVIVVESNKFS